jgi:hypothetical protein
VHYIFANLQTSKWQLDGKGLNCSHYQFIYCVKRNYQFSYSYMMHENYILALCNTNKIVNQKPINPIWQLNHNSSRVFYQ